MNTCFLNKGKATLAAAGNWLYFTCAVSQDMSDAQHLCTEDANGDKELWDDAKGPPQVFRCELSQIHGHNVGWETYREEKTTEDILF